MTIGLLQKKQLAHGNTRIHCDTLRLRPSDLQSMTTLTATRPQRKTKAKKSQFQKLWDKADRLQRKNTRLRNSLDGLVESAEKLVRPVEMEAAKADLPLLNKLLVMGQRKSLAQWERGVLDEWIKELVTSMQTFGIADDDLMNNIARYDAFRMGIELDDDADGASGTPYEQLSVQMQNLQKEAEAAAEQQRAEAEAEFNNLKDCVEEMIERMLDERLGPPPAADEVPFGTADMFADELDTELKKQIDEYNAKREALRKEIMDDLNNDLHDEFGGSPFDDDFGEDPFANPDFDFDTDYQHRGEDAFSDGDSRTNNAAPKIDNQTFHKMFRATAARLHPDREADPEKRLEKQRLMSELLSARKKGDLLTVFRMYQQYTDNSESFSKADEKQLVAALKLHIEQLEEEQEEIIYQSPMHCAAYHRFYDSSKKKQNAKIEEHLKEVRQGISASEKMTSTIKSLKTLKPWLEARYDHLRMSMLDELSGGFDLRDFDDIPY